MRVLIVDDSVDLRELLEALIARRAPEWDVVGHADNGQEAIEVARRTQPDVILLDVAMPVMDGLEALPLLREAAPDAGVIILSAFSGGTVGPMAEDRGALGFVEKTRMSQTLVPEMRRLMEGSRGPAGTPVTGVPAQVRRDGPEVPRPRDQSQAEKTPAEILAAREQEPITRDR